MKRRKNSIQICFLLMVALCLFARAEDSEQFAKGKAIEKVNCLRSPSFSYALYLPSAYTSEKTWPILFCFDAERKGIVPLELFRNAAEKYGYIIVSSNDSASDDASVPNLQAMLAVYEDAVSRFSLDKQRMYATGYSGGARIACDLAYRYEGQFAGVIGCGAGFPTDHEPSPQTPFTFFGTVGNLDFNYFEMRVLRRKLQAAGLPFKIRVFDGGHDWPTADICTEAIEWMEIQAMKSGKREKDAALIEELFQKRLKKAEEEKINGLLHQAADEFQSITSDFKSLRDVDSVSAEASQLKEVNVVKQWEQEEAKRDQTDLDFQQKMASVNRSIRNSTRKVPKKEDVLKFLEVEELKKKAKEAKSIDDRLQAKRLLTVVAIQNGFYLPRSLWEYGDYERLELTLSIATEIRPEEPYTWYALACAEAQLGKKEQAIDALNHAVEHGFKNFEKMETDFHLRSLQDEKQFKEIVKHLKQQQAS
ncbi:MAG TPA: hypothetical protein VLH08_22835 [Acidobacteriota bacterium]|nr:hypothetical protein [Acidobacteriota bacterium]